MVWSSLVFHLSSPIQISHSMKLDQISQWNRTQLKTSDKTTWTDLGMGESFFPRISDVGFHCCLILLECLVNQQHVLILCGMILPFFSSLNYTYQVDILLPMMEKKKLRSQLDQSKQLKPSATRLWVSTKLNLYYKLPNRTMSHPSCLGLLGQHFAVKNDRGKVREKDKGKNLERITTISIRR